MLSKQFEERVERDFSATGLGPTEYDTFRLGYIACLRRFANNGTPKVNEKDRKKPYGSETGDK